MKQNPRFLQYQFNKLSLIIDSPCKKPTQINFFPLSTKKEVQTTPLLLKDIPPFTISIETLRRTSSILDLEIQIEQKLKAPLKKHIQQHCSDFLKTAIFQIVICNMIEFVKNSIDAGASTMSFELLHTQEGFSFKIEDNGSGFSLCPKIKTEARLAPFQHFLSIGELKISSEKNQNHLGGAGRGLAQTNELLKAYNGELQIEQNRAQGAAFHFYSPTPLIAATESNVTNIFLNIQEQFSYREQSSNTLCDRP